MPRHRRCKQRDAAQKLISAARRAGAVDLCVVGIQMRVQTVVPDESQKVCCVQEEKDRTEDRALRDSTLQDGGSRPRTSAAHALCPSIEVRREPVEDVPAESVRYPKSVQQRSVVDCTELWTSLQSQRLSCGPAYNHLH